MRSLRNMLLAGGLAALGLTATACSDDDDEITGPAPPPPATLSELRLVHASPDAPAVDVYAEGITEPLLTDVAYGDVTPWLELEAGTYNVQIRPAGAAATSPPAFETGPLTLVEDVRITAVAAGLLGSTAGADAFRVLPLEEAFDPAGVDARVRVVHASPDAPTVAVDVGDDGSAEIPRLERFADTGAAGVALPAGEALQIGIRAGGERVTAFTTPALPAGGELFVIATGLLAEPADAADGFALLAVGSTGAIGLVRQNPMVYALHASPDAPAVDVFAGDTELAADLAFGELSGPIQVAPGAYTLDFFGAAAGTARPAGDPAGSFETPSLAAGVTYLATATGFLSPAGGEEAFELLAFEEAFGAAGSGARIRAVHASPDAPPVDVGTVSGGAIDAVVFAGLAFRDASEAAGAEVPATTLQLGVAPAGSTTPVATFDVTPAAGQWAFAVAAGALTPDAGEPGFRLLLVDSSVSPWAVAEVPAN